MNFQKYKSNFFHGHKIILRNKFVHGVTNFCGLKETVITIKEL